MTSGMSQVQTIRQLKREGESIAGISRRVGASRDTVCKHLEIDDFLLAMPVKRLARSAMDGYRPVIEGYSEEGASGWHKQGHAAKRIRERPRDGHGREASESTVRHYVARIRRNDEAGGTFPFSNVGLAQVFRGRNAECVCQGLKNAFEFVGGVTVLIWTISYCTSTVARLLLEQAVQLVLDGSPHELPPGCPSGSSRSVLRLNRAWLSSDMLLVSTTRIIPGRVVPSFLTGRYSTARVRKKLYVTLLSGVECCVR